MATFTWTRLDWVRSLASSIFTASCHYALHDNTTQQRVQHLGRVRGDEARCVIWSNQRQDDTSPKLTSGHCYLSLSEKILGWSMRLGGILFPSCSATGERKRREKLESGSVDTANERDLIPAWKEKTPHKCLQHTHGACPAHDMVTSADHAQSVEWHARKWGSCDKSQCIAS